MRYEFASILKNEFQEHLALRIASGRDSEPERCAMTNLDRFLVSKGISKKALPESLLVEWLADMDAKAQTRRWRLQAISPLIKYLTSIGIEATLPEKPRASSEYVPYIFSDNELSRIMDAADNRQQGRYKVDISAAAQLPFLLRLLYGCGLRAGEALSLKWGDIDLENSVIHIRSAKNDKQRIVPMSRSLGDLCRHYRYSGLTYSSDENFLFSNRKGGHYCLGRMWVLFAEVLKTAGIKLVRGQIGKRGPCLHCLRHLFVLRSFNNMEAEGYAFEEAVPYLSTYLGHDSIMETDKYLRFSHEICGAAYDLINVYTQGVFPEVTCE
jgi:integrase